MLCCDGLLVFSLCTLKVSDPLGKKTIICLPLGEMFALFIFSQVIFSYLQLVNFLGKINEAHLRNPHISKWPPGFCFSATRALFQSLYDSHFSFLLSSLWHDHRSCCTWMVLITDPNVTALTVIQYNQICVCDGRKERKT